MHFQVASACATIVLPPVDTVEATLQIWAKQECKEANQKQRAETVWGYIGLHRQTARGLIEKSETPLNETNHMYSLFTPFLGLI